MGDDGMKPTKIRTSIAFSRTLHAALKKRAKKQGMSMTDYVESLASKSLRRN